MKLLIVEDDRLISEFVRLILREEGHAVDVAENRATGQMLAAVHDFDAVVLDYNLPDGTGLDVLHELRSRGSAVPVLMLTSRSSEEDVVRCLDAGADDYLVKPFGSAELKARVRALLRRGGATRGEQLQIADLSIDRLTRRVKVRGADLSLTPKEYNLAEYLLLHAERVVTRSELLEKVWEMHFDPGSNVVDVHVARLRAKLERSGASVAIATVRGAGFMLVRAPAAASSCNDS